MEQQEMTSSVKKKIRQLREVLERALQSGPNDIQNLSQLLKILWQILEQLDCNEIVQSLGEYEIEGLLRILDMINVYGLTDHLLEQDVKYQYQSTSTSNEAVYKSTVVDTETARVYIQEEPQLGSTTNHLVEQEDQYQDKSTIQSSETVHENSVEDTESSNLDIQDEPQLGLSEEVQIKIRIHVQTTEVTSEIYKNSSNTEVEEASETDIAAMDVIREQIYDKLQHIKALHALDILRTVEAEEKVYFPHQIRLYNIIDFINSLSYNNLIFLLERIQMEQTVCNTIKPCLKNRKRLVDTGAYEPDFVSKRRKLTEEIEHIEGGELQNAAKENEIAETTNEATQESITTDSEAQKDTQAIIEIYFEGIDDVLHCIGGQYSEQDVVNLIEMIKSEFFLNNYSGTNDSASNNLPQESYNEILEKFTLGDIIRLKDRIIQGCISTYDTEVNIQTNEATDVASDGSDDTAYNNLMKRDFNDESTDDISLTDMKHFIDKIYNENLPKAGTAGKQSKKGNNKLSATDAVPYSPSEKLLPNGKKQFEEPLRESEVLLPNTSSLIDRHQSNDALELENDSEHKDQPNEGNNDKEKSALDSAYEYQSISKDNAIGDYQVKEDTTFSDFIDNIEECDPESLNINNLLKMFMDNKQSVCSSEKNVCGFGYLEVIPESELENELENFEGLRPIQEDIDELIIDVSHDPPVQEHVNKLLNGQLTDAAIESDKQNDVRNSLLNDTHTMLEESTNNEFKETSSNYLTNLTQVEEGELSNNFREVNNIDNPEDLPQAVKEDMIGTFLSMIDSSYPGLIPIEQDSNIPEDRSNSSMENYITVPAETESQNLDCDLLEATQKEKVADQISSSSDSENENGPRRVVTADGVLDLDADHSSSCVESWDILPDISLINLDDELCANDSCHKCDADEIKSSNLVEECISIEICHISLSSGLDCNAANIEHAEERDIPLISLSSCSNSEAAAHPNASVPNNAMNTPRRDRLQTFQTELSDAILDLRNHIRRRLEDQ